MNTAFHQKLSVPFAFPVVFTRHAFDPGSRVLLDAIKGDDTARRPRVFVVLDATLASARPELAGAVRVWFENHALALDLVAPPHLMPGGEQAKEGLLHVMPLIDLLVEHKMCRHSVVLVIGGGAVLDAAGLAVALVHRGLRIVRMPTTVLSQNDGGVGVKNAVNYGGAKNMLGTFSPPWAVVNDLDFLGALTPSDRQAGLAEAFKVALIRDAAFFEWLVTNATSMGKASITEEMVVRCAQQHLDHIRDGGDPFEMGQARPLDFGHWSAHHLEIMSGFHIPHGQAVASGIMLDSIYARKRGWLSSGELESIGKALRACGFPLWWEEMGSGLDVDQPELLRGLESFREHLGGELCLTFPRGIGARHEVHEVETTAMIDALRELRANFSE